MKMKLMLWCVAILWVACSTPEKQSDSIVITVDVQQKPEIGFIISYLRSEMRGIKFDEKGHGECVIEGLDAVYLTLHNGFSEEKIIYAEKGDRIHLAYDGKSMEKTLVITGGRQPIIDYLSRMKMKWPENDKYKLEIPAYMDYLQQLTDSNLLLLNTRKAELEKAGSKFVKLEEYRIRCSMSFMLLQYPDGHGWATGNQNYRPGEEYYAELRKWMVEDPDLVELYEYRILMTEGASIIAGQQGRYRNAYQKLLSQCKYIASEFKNEQVKQYMIDLLACDYLDQQGIRGIDELDRIYRANVKEKDLTTRYDRIYGEWEKLQPGNALADFTAADSSGRKYELKDFRGKKVCLYIWQNLYPCLKEYPYLDTLQPLFKANNIELVCLSIDTDKEGWKNTIRQKTTEPATHLYLGMDQDYLKSIRYQGIGMFQFLLLDEAGKIIEWKIPTPSSGKLAAFLQQKCGKPVEG